MLGTVEALSEGLAAAADDARKALKERFTPTPLGYAVFGSVDSLADALREAEMAHHIYETEMGHDPDWPLWYARHIVQEQESRRAQEATAALARLQKHGESY